jgi:sec-independent protein translocase protein TatA
MFHPKLLLVLLAVMLVIFGTKRLRTVGSDLGAAMKGFKQAVADGETEENEQRGKQAPGPALDLDGRESEIKGATKNVA